MRHQGYEVFVAKLDKTRFNEYQEENTAAVASGPSISSCFLESEQDCGFEVYVVWEDKRHRPYDVAINLSVDGRSVECFVPNRSQPSTKFSYIYTKEKGKNMRGRLTFAKLDTTDDVAEVTCTAHAELGSIRLEIWRGTSMGFTGETGIHTVPETVGTVLETTKKLGGTVKSTEKTSHVQPHPHIRFVYSSSTPDAVFRFNYRTRPALEVMNIVEPLPGAIKQATSTSSRKGKKSRDEIIDLDDEEEDTSSASKSDVKPTVPRKRKLNHGQVIDLDDLDGDENSTSHAGEAKQALLLKRTHFLEAEVAKLRKRVKKERLEDAEDVVDLSNELDDD